MTVNIINDNIDKIIMSETDSAMQDNEGKMKIELGFELDDARIKTGVVTLCVEENKVVTSKGTEVTPTGPWNDFEFEAITALLGGEELVIAERNPGEAIMVTVLAVVEPIREKVVSYYTQLMSKYEDPNQDFHNEELVEPTEDSANGTVPENEAMGFKHLESYEDVAKQNEDANVAPKKNIIHRQYGGEKTNGDLNKAVEAAMRYVSDTHPVHSMRTVYGVTDSGEVEMRGIINDGNNKGASHSVKEGPSSIGLDEATERFDLSTAVREAREATSDVLRNVKQYPSHQELRQQNNTPIQGEYTEVGEVPEDMYNSPAFQHLMHGSMRVMNNAVIQGANASEQREAYFTMNGNEPFQKDDETVERPIEEMAHTLTEETAAKASKLVEGMKGILTNMPTHHSDSESTGELANALAESMQEESADDIVKNDAVGKTGNPFKDYGLNADLDISKNLVPTLQTKYYAKLNELGEKGAKADKVVEKVNLIFKQQQISLIQKLQAKRAADIRKKEELTREAEEKGKPAPILDVGHSASCSTTEDDVKQDKPVEDKKEFAEEISANEEVPDEEEQVTNDSNVQEDILIEETPIAQESEEETAPESVKETPIEEANAESEVDAEEFLSDEVEQEVTFVGEEGTANDVIGQEPLFADSDVQEESSDKSRLEYASKGNANTNVSGDSAVDTGDNSVDDVINISDFDHVYEEFITGLKWNTVEFKEVNEESAKFRKRFEDIVYMLWQAKCSNMNTLRVIIGFDDDEPIAMGDFIINWGSGIEFKEDRRIEAFHNDATLRCVYPGYPVNLKVGATAILSLENTYLTLIDIYCESEVRTSYVSMDLWNYVTVLQETIEGIVYCM